MSRKANVIRITLVLLLTVLATLGWSQREALSYAAQAAGGQARLLLSARPLNALIADPATAPALRARLEKARAIREFAVNELGLPDNGNFTTYVDVGAPFVVWNVVATSEFSVKPMQWCYPIAGCFDYRGYYSQADAEEYASRLRSQGYAVQIDGVTAFSTLGWFSDPLLSTVIGYSETQLARLIFHELAHSRLWVKGDTRFNEAFAVAVEEEGVRRWLEHTSDPAKRAGYAQYTRRKTEFLSLLDQYRQKLTESFSSQASLENKRRDKAALMRDMQGEYKQLRASWGGYNGYDEWFRDSVDNAHLASFATYHALVPGFRELLARSTGIAQFYKTAASMAELPEQQRRAQLLSLGGQAVKLKVGTHQISAMPVKPPKQGESSRPVKVSLRTG